jgi:hypothetical protein
MTDRGVTILTLLYSDRLILPNPWFGGAGTGDTQTYMHYIGLATESVYRKCYTQNGSHRFALVYNYYIIVILDRLDDIII